MKEVREEIKRVDRLEKAGKLIDKGLTEIRWRNREMVRSIIEEIVA